MYALLDWDNTLRSGATLFQWEDYLVACGEMSDEVQKERKELFRRLHSGEISHDTLSEECCRSFLRFAAGMTKEHYNQLLAEYLPHDRISLAPHMPIVFRWLKCWNILPIIVSGSPEAVLHRYGEEFGFSEVFAFKCAFENNILTDHFYGNGGGNKREVVEYCCRKYGQPPILAFGDSESDRPMLEAATIPVVVGSLSSLRESFPSSPYLDCTQQSLPAWKSLLDKLLLQLDSM